MPTGYHPGELAAQEQAGQRHVGARMVRSIKPSIPAALSRFLAGTPWVIIGGSDRAHRLWAGMVFGTPGFVEVVDDATVSLTAPSVDDPLYDLGRDDDGAEVGLLVIDLDRRMRARINGTARCIGDRLLVDVDQCYANCPKYIQRRELLEPSGTPASSYATDDHLPETWVDLVRRADTAFIATIAPGHGADCSHRGGVAGFLECDPSGRHIRFRDYPGNGMFNTLGNLQLDHRVGLTIPDFRTGGLLQISGRAEVVVASPEDRTVVLTVERAVHRTHVLPWRFGPMEYSPQALEVRAAGMAQLGGYTDPLSL